MAYNETAAIATLEYAAKYKDSLLFNRYQAGRDQIARGRKEPPFAYVVPQEQRDPVAAVEMLRRLAFGGVRVIAADRGGDVRRCGVTPPGHGSCPPTRNSRALAREVLDVQKYPDLRQYPGGPPLRPYDAAGWTLPLQMGVLTIPVMSPVDEETRSKMKRLGPPPLAASKPVPYRDKGSRDAAAVRQRARHRLRHERRRRRHRAAAGAHHGRGAGAGCRSRRRTTPTAP